LLAFPVTTAAVKSSGFFIAITEAVLTAVYKIIYQSNIEKLYFDKNLVI
jgi:hypothetical protein